MTTLREVYKSETKFTQFLASTPYNLNKINKLVGLPEVVEAKNEFTIPGGSIDVVGFTNKKEVIIYEHQDITGLADQIHASKTPFYATVMSVLGYKVIGAILLCENVTQLYLDTYKKYRWSAEKRGYNGNFNVHIVKTEFTDDGVYIPSLFEETEIKQKENKPIVYYKNFVDIFAREWTIQREDVKGQVKTLWFKDVSNGFHYIHTLKNNVKVGIHFNNPTQEEKDLVTKLGGRHLQTKSTFEVVLPLEASDEDIFNEAEKLKRLIRKEQI